MKRTSSPATAKPPLFARRRDWVIVVCLLAAGLLFLAIRAFSGSGGVVAVVTVALGDEQQELRLSLGRDRVESIEGALPVQLEIREGGIRFVGSVCPDHDCEGFGWLRNEGDWAACLPAEVVVQIEASS